MTTPPDASAPTTGQRLLSSVSHHAREYAIVLAFLVISAIPAFLSPYFLTVQNLSNILLQVSINGLLAIGMTFVVLAGGIDLSVGSILAAAGMIAGSLVTGDHPVSIWIALVVGLGLGAGLGGINGVLVAWLRVPPFVATLGMLSAARGLTQTWSDGMPVPDLSDNFVAIGQGHFLGLAVPVWIYLGCALVAAVVLRQTRYGRYVYAVGGNARSAQTSGVSVKFVTFLTFLISGLTAGLAGLILTARTSSALPQAGIGYELDAIAAVVIGGTSLSGGLGGMLGTFFGVLIIGVINNGLDLLGVSSYLQQIIKGVIIVAAVMVDMQARKQTPLTVSAHLNPPASSNPEKSPCIRP
ncbi:MAG: ABC transporter permease [Verrucomicrobiota bacterium]